MLLLLLNGHDGFVFGSWQKKPEGEDLSSRLQLAAAIGIARGGALHARSMEHAPTVRLSSVDLGGMQVLLTISAGL